MSADVLKLLSKAERRRRGLTLIEAAMVLVILALVIGGVMLYYQTASQSRQITETATQLAAIQQAVRSVNAGSADYSGITNAVISEALPKRMIGATADQLRHAFNGTVTVTPVSIGGGTGSGFTVFLQGIPYEACKRLAVLDLGRSTLGLAVPGTAGGVVLNDAPPWTPAKAQACGTSGTVNMTWTFS